MTYQLIIFDLDDTLFDYKQTEVYALKKACEEQSIVFNLETYNNYKEANNLAKNELINYLKNLNDFRKIRVKKFFDILGLRNKSVDKFLNTYLNNSQKGFLIDGVEETLKKLNGIRKVVATNGSTFPRLQKLETSSIFHFFDKFYSSEMIGFEKPENSFFDYILKDQNVSNDKVLVIGDGVKTDIKGAIESKIDCCLFDRKKEFVESQRFKIIHNFTELIDIIYSKPNDNI